MIRLFYVSAGERLISNALSVSTSLPLRLLNAVKACVSLLLLLLLLLLGLLLQCMHCCCYGEDGYDGGPAATAAAVCLL